jgi:hypothetical protein
VVTGFTNSYTSLAHSMSATDLSKVKGFLCTKDQQAVQAIYDHEKSSGGADSGFSMKASGVATKGDAGSFNLILTDNGSASQSHKGSLVRQNSQWLVCDTLSGSGS